MTDIWINVFRINEPNSTSRKCHKIGQQQEHGTKKHPNDYLYCNFQLGHLLVPIICVKIPCKCGLRRSTTAPQLLQQQQKPTVISTSENISKLQFSTWETDVSCIATPPIHLALSTEGWTLKQSNCPRTETVEININ